jgi:hypothetical protein
MIYNLTSLTRLQCNESLDFASGHDPPSLERPKRYSRQAKKMVTIQAGRSIRVLNSYPIFLN